MRTYLKTVLLTVLSGKSGGLDTVTVVDVVGDVEGVGTNSVVVRSMSWR